MKSVQLAWVFGAVSALGLGMAAEACSSSSSPTTPVDGGHPTSGTGTSPQTSGTGSSTGTGTGTCYSAPGDLFAEDGGTGVYCPFSGPDGGKAIHCTPGQHCCEPPESAAMVSTCEPAATVCGVKDSTDWGCEGTPDCSGSAGTICCGSGTISTQAPQPGCGDGGSTIPSYPYVKEFNGTSCVAAASCTGDTSFQVCSKDSECPSGSCVSIKPKGNGIGYCTGSGTGTSSGTGSSTGTGSASGTGTGSASGSGTGSTSGSGSSSSSGSGSTSGSGSAG